MSWHHSIILEHKISASTQNRGKRGQAAVPAEKQQWSPSPKHELQSFYFFFPGLFFH